MSRLDRRKTWRFRSRLNFFPRTIRFDCAGLLRSCFPRNSYLASAKVIFSPQVLIIFCTTIGPGGAKNSQTLVNSWNHQLHSWAFLLPPVPISYILIQNFIPLTRVCLSHSGFPGKARSQCSNSYGIIAPKLPLIFTPPLPLILSILF